MLTLIAIAVASVTAWGAVDFCLSLTRKSALGSLLVYAVAFASGAIIPWAIIDGVAFALRGDKAVEA